MLKSDLSSNINLNKLLNDSIINWWFYYIIFRIFFKIKKVKALVLVVSAGSEPIIQAAKDISIPTIELQHGSPQRGKLNYDYSNSIIKKSFPDYFLSFGDYWNKNITLPIKNDKIISFGYPYLSSKYSLYKKNEKEENFVIISQPVHFAKLANLAIVLNNKFKNSIKVIFKPHPADYTSFNENQFNILNKSGVEIANKNTDLYLLLSKSKWVLGVFSTAIYEAIHFNNFCFIFNVSGSSFMDDIVSMGFAKMINKVDDICLDVNFTKHGTNVFF